MQVLVLYFSRSGNTKKLADAIAEGVRSAGGVEAMLRSTDEVTKEDFLNSEGVVAGSPVYFGGMASQLKDVFDRFVTVRQKMGDKIGAAFATSGDQSGGKETTMFSIIQALMIYGMIIVGDPLDATGHYGVSCTGTPDDKTLANARKLGARVAALARKLKA